MRDWPDSGLEGWKEDGKGWRSMKESLECKMRRDTKTREDDVFLEEETSSLTQRKL
jgi:hypothetical protein